MSIGIARTFVRVVALAVSFGTPLMSWAASAPPPAQAFGTTPDFTTVALSPNGKLLAMDQPLPAGFRIVMLEVAGGKQVRMFEFVHGEKLRGLRWSDDTTLLIDASITHAFNDVRNILGKYEISRTIAAYTSRATPQVLLMDDLHAYITGADIQAVHIARPGKIIMSSYDFGGAHYQQQTGTMLHDARRDSGFTHNLYEVDTATGAGRMTDGGSQYTVDWVVDESGAAVARSEWSSEDRRYTVLVKSGAGWREIFRSDDDGLTLAGLSMDGKSIVAIGDNGSGPPSKAWAFPLDGGPASVLYQDSLGDVQTAERDEFTGAVVGLYVGGGTQDIHWLDPKRESQSNALHKAFPGKRLTRHDRSASGRQVLLSADSPSEPPVYYLVDFDRGAADIVGEAYPGLVGAKLGEMSEIQYNARDGTPIPAFLTLPPDREPKQLPLVVLPHGGPASHDELEFNWWSQFLATRGYAVLQPQFRGSTGYGEAFRRAGYRQWGGLMQDDVTDGVRHLIADGTADPQRICIVGGSYGGYAALAGAAFTPDLYACAASINGISDLPSFFGYIARRAGDDSDSASYWKDHVGSPLDAATADKSPARAADRVRAPVLLIHSVDDVVVPIGQSERMLRVLEEAGKPVEFVRLEGDDHWLSRSATRVRMLEKLEEFLGKHLAAAAH